MKLAGLIGGITLGGGTVLHQLYAEYKARHLEPISGVLLNAITKTTVLAKPVWLDHMLGVTTGYNSYIVVYDDDNKIIPELFQIQNETILSMSKQDIVCLANECNKTIDCSNAGVSSTIKIEKGSAVYFDHPRKCQIITTSPNTFKEQARKYYGANYAKLLGGMAAFAYCVFQLRKLMK